MWIKVTSNFTPCAMILYHIRDYMKVGRGPYYHWPTVSPRNQWFYFILYVFSSSSRVSLSTHNSVEKFSSLRPSPRAQPLQGPYVPLTRRITYKVETLYNVVPPKQCTSPEMLMPCLCHLATSCANGCRCGARDFPYKNLVHSHNFPFFFLFYSRSNRYTYIRILRYLWN